MKILISTLGTLSIICTLYRTSKLLLKWFSARQKTQANSHTFLIFVSNLVLKNKVISVTELEFQLEYFTAKLREVSNLTNFSGEGGRRPDLPRQNV